MNNTSPLNSRQALDLLLAGNRRFVSGTPRHRNPSSIPRPATTSDRPPLAALFACSDSLLDPHTVFDCEPGDLYIVQTPGHLLGSAVLGSIEHSVRALQCPLVVVLGHPSCGVVTTAHTAIKNGSNTNGALRQVVERIAPSILNAYVAGHTDDDQLIDEHIRATTTLLLDRSPLLNEKVTAKHTTLIGLTCDPYDGTARILTAHGLDGDASGMRDDD